MSSETNAKPLRSIELMGPARYFSLFCEAELKRLRKSEIDFDAELYNEAVKFVLRKLGVVHEESL
jgi:hypothetical protein